MHTYTLFERFGAYTILDNAVVLDVWQDANQSHMPQVPHRRFWTLTEMLDEGIVRCGYWEHEEAFPEVFTGLFTACASGESHMMDNDADGMWELWGPHLSRPTRRLRRIHTWIDDPVLTSAERVQAALEGAATDVARDARWAAYEALLVIKIILARL